jgi:hypothetical protein
MEKWKLLSIRARVMSTPKRLVNQIDSVVACLDGTGTSEINDSSSRVNPAVPECLHHFAKTVVKKCVRELTSFADRIGAYRCLSFPG